MPVENPDGSVTMSRAEYDKFVEYQEVAALLAWDIELAWKSVEVDQALAALVGRLDELSDIDADHELWPVTLALYLLKQLRADKSETIQNAERRRERYQSCALLFAATVSS